MPTKNPTQPKTSTQERVVWTPAMLQRVQALSHGRPRERRRIRMTLDADVLDYFKRQGRNYQIPMNAVLRTYMEAQQGK